MKKMVLVLTLAVFALTGSAFAQDPNYFDNIGLYMTPGGYVDPGAEDGTGSCGLIPEEDVPFQVYVVLSKLTNPEVWFWEAKMPYTNMLFGGFELSTLDAVNIATREDEYVVGLATPLVAVDDAVVAGWFTFLISSYFNDITMPSYMGIETTYYPSLPGVPSYLIEPDGDIIELHPALDGDHQLIINGDCDVVAVESSSWGSLKSLYR